MQTSAVEERNNSLSQRILTKHSTIDPICFLTLTVTFAGQLTMFSYFPRSYFSKRHALVWAGHKNDAS